MSLYSANHNHRPVGMHAIIDAYDAHDAPLNDPQALAAILRYACERAGATVMDTITRTFQPSGVSVALVLAESHATVHTYPEHNVYMADIFTCGDVSPIAAAELLMERMGGTATISVIMRGYNGRAEEEQDGPPESGPETQAKPSDLHGVNRMHR